MYSKDGGLKTLNIYLKAFKMLRGNDVKHMTNSSKSLGTGIIFFTVTSCNNVIILQGK